MTIVPLLEDSIAGRYAKIISDAWYMDRKDTLSLLDLLKLMEEDVRKDAAPLSSHSSTAQSTGLLSL